MFTLLEVTALEDRTLLSADLTGYNASTGIWKSAVLTADGVIQTTTLLHWDPVNLMAVVQGDFDGDGARDVAAWSAYGYWVVGRAASGSGGTGTTEAPLQSEDWSTDLGPRLAWKAFLVGDFNDDGRDDVAMFAPDGSWYVAASTGSAFEMQRWGDSPWSPAGQWRAIEAGDFNGDGRTDVAAVDASGGWQVGVSTGASFVTQSWLPDGTLAKTADWTSTVVGDFNGDHSADIAVYQTSGAWWVGLSTGSSFSPAVWATGLPRGAAWKSVHAGDFNDDGLADVAALDRHGKLWTFISTEAAFTASTTALHDGIRGLPIRLNAGDFNGDGVDDLAVLYPNGNFAIETSSSGTGFAHAANGALGRGTWVNTFAGDRREPDPYVNHHRNLHNRTSHAYITSGDMAALRHDPTYFATIFQIYKIRLAVELGPAFSDVGDEGLAFCLSSIVAYQAAYYRGVGDPQGYFAPPPRRTLPVMLRGYKLVCNDYCYLAAELYRMAIPVATDPNTHISMLGFGSGPFGNHAQLVFSNGAIAILGDPTLGLVARTTFQYLRTGHGLPAGLIRQLIVRPEKTSYMQCIMQTFRSEVYTALRTGGYHNTSLIYVRNATNVDGGVRKA
jgi:hypothetical protein